MLGRAELDRFSVICPATPRAVDGVGTALLRAAPPQVVSFDHGRSKPLLQPVIVMMEPVLGLAMAVFGASG